jgi:beta-galactosidase
VNRPNRAAFLRWSVATVPFAGGVARTGAAPARAAAVSDASPARAAALSDASPARAAAVSDASPALRIVDGRFFLHGSPLQIVCGELHYPRIPRAYWRARLDMARAMGLNTIATYVFWNVHEPQPGRFDFAGSNDLAAFVQLAQAAGLHVMLRAGPYVCAEWDLGGLPAWLLADPAARLRVNDERFMAPVRRWLRRLGSVVAPLTATRGGPIIAIQIENEYGSFGSDPSYLQAMHAAFAAAGLTTELNFTADGPTQLRAGSIPGVVPFVNSASPRTEISALRTFAPQTALMCSEYYPGWFDHWGEPHHLTAASDACSDVEWVLARGDSINLYLFHGGTSFGFHSGANATADGTYQPTTTSYDYDAPLDEGGAPTEKFTALRAVITRYTGAAPAIPATPRRIAIPSFALSQSAPYTGLLGAARRVAQPRHMESFGQSFGSMLYRTRISGPRSGTLDCGEVRDYAVVTLDADIVGVLDRRLAQRALPLEIGPGPHALGIFVESMGRINYGRDYFCDRKGLLGPVRFAARELVGWEAFTLPMDDLRALRFGSKALPAPAFYRGTFELSELGDTYLDVRMLGKGALWVNGHNAGRFWQIGPQYSLFVPREWLRPGANEVIAFDLIERSERRIAGTTAPIFAPLAE